MDTIKYIKKCPQCGTEIDPRWNETTRPKLLSESLGLCGGVVGFSLGDSVTHKLCFKTI